MVGFLMCAAQGSQINQVIYQLFEYDESVPEYNPKNLIKLTSMKMPFGKYSGTTLIDLPEPYVVWFYQNSLPQGELGQLISELYEIKVNGLESLVKSMNL